MRPFRPDLPTGTPESDDDRRAEDVPLFGANDFFEMSLDNLCVAGLDGYFKRLNPSWTRTLGWSAEELMSKPSVEFVHPDDREATLAGRERLKGGAPLGNHINRYLCKDGTYRWFEWRSIAHSALGLVYAAARDITERKDADARLGQAKVVQEQLERQLLLADRMASVGTLAGGVAHEINNPLAAMVANVTLLIEELPNLGAQPSNSKAAELVEMALDVRAGAERIRKIVHGLQTFARVEVGSRAAIELTSVLELSIGMAFHEIRHRARLVRDYGETPLVHANDAQLGQVFVHLLVNAAQAVPEGDSTTNEVRIVTSTDAAGRAVVEIRDTGEGIPADLIGRVFDPFFTTKPVGVGTGLGLSVCHSIVKSLGGEISVSSELARGTTFRVVLPGAPAQDDRAHSAPSPATAHASAAVLVVDDDRAVGRAIRRVLRDHEVTVVTRAKEALAILGSRKHFDIVFSDLMMPEMSGMELYDEIAERFPGVARRVVFISGGAFTPSARSFLERVANERIEKPFDPARVREMVRRSVE